ncbi:peptide-methionine (S)-S-oxide reductase MsrA [Persicitalea jodogahamensis]|uniref:Peptide methionine sulfoxide reductase MsrA n=1 Tax=Persicitalea jodogahamensis TaxID=402147 RepID=A0A8J3D3J3_9BACT|nr:peptide-methionine (S)-S-oxide reductase MsrA [Persicitalea jodogahamensis]GHB76743.1 peptide methionine sulfoxide reductase MsrA [Persicitalea jodogahamensis]
MRLYKIIGVAAASLMLGAASCETTNNQQGKDNSAVRDVALENSAGQATAAFAEGCFWCTEEIFEAVVGVDSVISGYAGGHTQNPTYDLVNTETTGHAETVLVYYDPAKISYEELVNVFYLSHDPTTLNQQGPDRGTSYRSILFYQTPEEKATAERLTAQLNKDRFDGRITTEVKKLDKFYRAEGYHQDYIEHNPGNPYVQNVSIPRFKKFKAAYKGALKEGV